MKKSKNNLAKKYLFNVYTIKPYPVDAWTSYAEFLFGTNDLNTTKVAYIRVLSLKPE